MGVFKLESNLLAAKDVSKYKELEKDKFHQEFKAVTDVFMDYRDRTLVSVGFYLKRSHYGLRLFYVEMDYDNKRILKYDCKVCGLNQYDRDMCYHLIYLLECYNNGLVTGALSKEEITLKYKKIKEKLRLQELEKIRKENLKFLSILERKISNKNENLTTKKASIIPNFTISTTNGIDFTNELDLKIKVDKAYVIKDLLDFIQLVNTGGVYEYGKNFSFKHNINNFDDSAKRLISLLTNFSYDSSWYNKRVKSLSPLVAQEMINAYQGKTVLLDGENYNVILEDYEPYISIKDSQIVIEDMNLMTIIPGQDYDFVCLNSNIYKLACDEELRHLVRFVIGNKNFNLESVKDEFSKQIVSRFVDDIELDDNFKEEYLIKDLDIEAYFDFEVDDEGVENENVIEVNTKYYLDNEEVDKDLVANNNFISKKYTKYNSILEELGFVDGKIEDVNTVGNFLTCDLENLKKYCTVYLSDKIKSLSVKKLKPIVTNISYKTGMLDVCFEELNFSDEDLYKIIRGIRKKTKFIRLSKNVIFEADDETSAQLLNVVDEFNLKQDKLTQKQEVPLYQGMKLMSDENVNHFGKIKMDDTIQNMINEIAHYKEMGFTIPDEVKGVLREYQENAFYWLKTLVKYNFCGILADDMGLGKTLEIISLILSDPEEKPSLIVCPKSLIYNWNSEFKKWAKSLNAVVVSGTIDERKSILRSIKNDKKTIFITSYDSLKNDLESYKSKKFRFCILDEAQFIKNHLTLKAKSVKQITSEIRFALTGTPIENTVLDLWSLFDFLMPNYLYKYQSFKDDFEKQIINKNNKSVIKKLVKKITPFVLRRTKKEVLKDLPEKIETIRYASMGEEQRKVYEAQLLKTRMSLEGKTKLMILSDLTRLRQLCVHPKMFVEEYEGESCKIDLVLELLDDLIPNGHKVLIFSQFTSVFSYLEYKLNEKEIDYFRLTGETPSKLRLEMAEEFNKSNSSQKVFLISLKAGGTGLNLVGADTVIQLDPWWNVSAENQASDRAHRIGQKNIVQVMKIICEDSIEQKVIELQEAKKNVIDQVIADNDENIIKLSDSDIQYLLN